MVRRRPTLSTDFPYWLTAHTLPIGQLGHEFIDQRDLVRAQAGEPLRRTFVLRALGAIGQIQVWEMIEARDPGRTAAQ